MSQLSQIQYCHYCYNCYNTQVSHNCHIGHNCHIDHNRHIGHNCHIVHSCHNSHISKKNHSCHSSQIVKNLKTDFLGNFQTWWFSKSLGIDDGHLKLKNCSSFVLMWNQPMNTMSNTFISHKTIGETFVSMTHCIFSKSLGKFPAPLYYDGTRNATWFFSLSVNVKSVTPKSWIIFLIMDNVAQNARHLRFLRGMRLFR